MTMFNWGGASGGGASGGGASGGGASGGGGSGDGTGSRWRLPSRYADRIAAAVRPRSERSRPGAGDPAATPLRRLGRLAAAAGCVFAAGVLLGASGGLGAAAGTLMALAGLAAAGAAARMLWPLLSRGG